MRRSLVASVLSFVVTLYLVQPLPAFAGKLLDVYVAYVKVKDPDAARTTDEQKNMLAYLTKLIRQELKKSPRVNVDTELGISTWFMDSDWEELAQSGKTHFIVAIPEVTNDGTSDDFIKVSWEVGQIGNVGGKMVPVFAGSLSPVATAKIIRTATGAAIENSRPEDKASAIADTMRKIFPELGSTFSYFIGCFEIDKAPNANLATQWSQRRQELLTKLLSQLSTRNELQYATEELINPSDEARSICLDDPDKRSATAKKADFLLRGVASNLPAARIAVRVTVQNRPGSRRLHNDLTYQPNALSPAFYKQVFDWSTKYEGNSAWELSACGKYPEFWGAEPKLESFAGALATGFQEKLAIEVDTTVNRRSCR